MAAQFNYMVNQMSDATLSYYKDLGALHRLLLEICPPDPETNKKSIPGLANQLGVTHQYVYKWIENNRVPVKQAKKLVQMSNGQKTLNDFSDFL